MEAVVTTGAISRAKLQSNYHHQQTNTEFFLQAGCPSCRPTNSVKALKVKISHSMDMLTPSSPGVFQHCLWPLIAPGYLGEGCHASHQPSDASTPIKYEAQQTKQLSLNKKTEFSHAVSALIRRLWQTPICTYTCIMDIHGVQKKDHYIFLSPVTVL